MCGIVSYFGGAGNGLARILAGMSAIIYRAPDSTGVGVLGDEQSPFRALRALGGLPALVETLVGQEIHPSWPADWLGLFIRAFPSEQCLADLQLRLLQFERFSPQADRSSIPGAADYISIDDLLSVDAAAGSASIQPGRCGCPQPEKHYRVAARSELASLLTTLMNEYDLSAVVCKTLMSCALRKEGEAAERGGTLRAPLAAILEGFEDLFEDIFWAEILGAEKDRSHCGSLALSGQAEDAMWDLMARTTFIVPTELDRDGVRRVLRDLEVAVMCRLRTEPHVQEELGEYLRRLWPGAEDSGKFSWRDMFLAEKAANVYGWAAAAAFAYIRQQEVLPGLGPGADVGGLTPGATDPHTLRYLATPILAHGRWALQSAVTVENAHPFTDQHRERGVVLNGQFNGVTEANLLRYLENSGVGRRSGNSAELLPLLWEVYYHTLSQEKNRYETIRRQMDAGLEDLYLGSQAVDYRICRQIQDKSSIDLDSMAFAEASRRIVSDGGQLAAAAVSVRSPQRLYVAAHHRPVFIVQRKDTGDVMVVSDVYAALGLFPQSLIVETSRELLRIDRERRLARQPSETKEQPASAKIAAIEKEFDKQRTALLEPFAVHVFHLEGTSLLACIETCVMQDGVHKQIRISDFSGTIQPDLEEAIEVILNPLQTRRHLFQSFYEAHLEEIPERLRDGFGFYLPEADGIPRLPLHDRYLRRRFGAHLERLKRVVLVGMGSSYRTALMCRSFYQAVVPRLTCEVLRPVEVEQVERRIDSDRDLVVLLSVSGTSADMVELTNDIIHHHGTVIGISEKPFSDLGLIAARSGGVIPTLSGEEVTFTALKSSICTALICRLLAVWLACKEGRETRESAVYQDLLGIPALFAEVLNNESIERFRRQIADESVRSHAVVVFDAVHTMGTGLEAAEKLEETSWTAVGKALDYRDLLLAPLEKDLNSNLVIVNATGAQRLNEALSVMKHLYVSETPFVAVTFEHSLLNEMRFYSRGRCIDLPKVHDANQPMIDLAFYYPLAREFGMAHGRRDPGFPRNRAKSVTVARHRPAHAPSIRQELKALRAYAQTPPGTALPHLDEQTMWETKAGGSNEADYYRGMRLLAGALLREQPLHHLLASSPTDLSMVASALGESLLEGGEIVFVPLDRSSRAVAKNLTSVWRRLSKASFDITEQGVSLENCSEDACMIFLGAPSSGADDFIPLSKRARPLPQRLWVSCTAPRELEELFATSLGVLELHPAWQTIQPDALYAAVNLLLIEALKTRKPEEKILIGRVFRLAALLIETVLQDGRLWEEIAHTVAENLGYRTAAMVGPGGGTGDLWALQSEQAGAWLTESYIYGESAHGPVVTVDPSPQRKFVAVSSRKELSDHFGLERVEGWEKRYLRSRSIDEFCASPGLSTRLDAVGPFSASGRWYLPVLRPDYDPVEDNLIFLDATRQRYLDRALDELSLYGCRFARVVLICQQAFVSLPSFAELYHYPVSQALVLPALSMQEGSQPIPEILLPFAMSLTGMAVAARNARQRGGTERLTSIDHILPDAFGAMGELLQEMGVDLGNLNHRVIEALLNLAPVVQRATGTAVYRVQRIESTRQLDEILSGSKVYGAEQVVQGFRASIEAATPYYLIYPERRLFLGEAEVMAKEALSDDYWEQWFEIYGDSWRCLFRRRVEMNEGPGERPRIELPILNSEQDIDRLLHLYVTYREWDYSGDLAAQIDTTAAALGKHRLADDPQGSEYTKIISQFNNAVIPEGYLWEDAFFVLLPRSHLFRKPGDEAALRIAERLVDLGRIVTGKEAVFTREKMVSALHAVWPRLHGAKWEAAQHWQNLAEAIIHHFSGELSEERPAGL